MSSFGQRDDYDWSSSLRTIPSELKQSYLDAGLWTNGTIADLVIDGLTRHKMELCTVQSLHRPARVRLGAVGDLARRLATGLVDIGLKAGDVVSFQMPNWIEAIALFYAATLVGAVVVPIPVAYTFPEVLHILRTVRPSIHATADRFGQQDFLERIEPIWAAIETLESIVVLGSQGSRSLDFDDLAISPRMETFHATHDVDAPALVAFTAGSSSVPKGVIHTNRSIVAEVHQLAVMQPPEQPPVLVGAPVAHAIGLLSAILLPLALGRGIHVIDVWNPKRVLEAMTTERLTSGSGPPFFISSLIDHPDFDEEHLALLPYVGLGGAPTPEELESRLQTMGISAVRMYGSTEHPSITGALHTDRLADRAGTEGRALAGVELRFLDDRGSPGARDDSAQIFSRGPDLCAGYVDPEQTAASFDADGWYATGDLGYLTEAGYLVLTGRCSELIIRGGQNISPVEIEQALANVPGIDEAVVVGKPDKRLGETVVAVVVGHDLELSMARNRMRELGLSPSKWPTEIVELENLPRTPSGKVDRAAVRALISGDGSS